MLFLCFCKTTKILREKINHNQKKKEKIVVSRVVLSEEKVAKSALEAIALFHAETVKEVAVEIAKNRVVVVGMAMNPVVRKACSILSQEAVSFRYLEYGSYFSEWKKRLAIKLWSGWPTFPQIFVDGVLIGGCSDLEAELRSGEFRKRLSSN